MIVFLLRRCFFASAAFLIAFFASIFALPWFFSWYEAWSGAPLPYEGALRFILITTIELLLVASLSWLLIRGRRSHWLLWWIQCVSYGTLLIIFFGDTTHRLMEEFSWIRYTTAGFLVAAAIVAILLAYTKGTPTAVGVPFVFWVFVAGTFLYAGFDEVFEIHEAMGRFIETKLQLPHVTTDLITVGYAVAALLAIFWMYRRKIFAIRDIAQSFPFLVFVLGGVTYFFSTMFDTVDVIIGQKLRVLANTLAINPSFVFGDAWYAVWAPKNFFNGLEEVFEHTAAALFFSALLILFLEKRSTPGVIRSNTGCCSANRQWFVWSIATLSGIVLVASIGASWSFLAPTSPVMQADMRVARIASYFDGLSHTDDLFYHPAWGVLVANEGKGNIYQWKPKVESLKSKVNGQWRVLPDTNKVLRDTDSITADENFVYVSDGSQGTIFRSSGKGDWEALWTKKDGLKHPEGIVAVGDALYVVDESEKSLTKLVRGLKPEVWKPKHPDWRAPEGIAYDRKRGVLVVTDDVSGAVFSVDFGKSVTPLARFSNPEDVVVAPDGRILVTDNGWGAVFVINRDGTTEKIVQFRRSYRDLQGITLDDAGRLYVVSADGFDSVSFMPSFLFEVTPPNPLLH